MKYVTVTGYGKNRTFEDATLCVRAYEPMTETWYRALKTWLDQVHNRSAREDRDRASLRVQAYEAGCRTKVWCVGNDEPYFVLGSFREFNEQLQAVDMRVTPDVGKGVDKDADPFPAIQSEEMSRR